jgi:hypothetical protein
MEITVDLGRKAVSAPSGNLVLNPGFETDTSGWAAVCTVVLGRVAGGHSGGWAGVVRMPAVVTACGMDDTPNCRSTGTRYVHARVGALRWSGATPAESREYQGSTLSVPNRR